jgi:hypothetical protein
MTPYTLQKKTGKKKFNLTTQIFRTNPDQKNLLQQVTGRSAPKNDTDTFWCHILTINTN